MMDFIVDNIKIISEPLQEIFKKITITKDKFKKTLVVYPAMWSEKNKEKTIYLRDSYIKYSKPFAVQKILDEIAL